MARERHCAWSTTFEKVDETTALVCANKLLAKSQFIGYFLFPHAEMGKDFGNDVLVNLSSVYFGEV